MTRHHWDISWGSICLLCWCPLKRWSHSLCPLDSTCSLWHNLILPLPTATELDFSFAFLLFLRYLTLFPFRCKEFWTCQNSILFSYYSNLYEFIHIKTPHNVKSKVPKKCSCVKCRVTLIAEFMMNWLGVHGESMKLNLALWLQDPNHLRAMPSR